MSSNKFDSAVLDLGDDEGVTHSFGKNIPDSALDQVNMSENFYIENIFFIVCRRNLKDDEFLGDDTEELLGEGNGQKAFKSFSFW